MYPETSHLPWLLLRLPWQWKHSRHRVHSGNWKKGNSAQTGTRICARRCMGRDSLELMVILFMNTFSTFGLPWTTKGMHCITGWARVSLNMAVSHSLLRRSLSSLGNFSGHFWKYLEYPCLRQVAKQLLTELSCERILNSYIRGLCVGACFGRVCVTCCLVKRNLSTRSMGTYSWHWRSHPNVPHVYIRHMTYHISLCICQRKRSIQLTIWEAHSHLSQLACKALSIFFWSSLAALCK